METEELLEIAYLLEDVELSYNDCDLELIIRNTLLDGINYYQLISPKGNDPDDCPC